MMVFFSHFYWRLLRDLVVLYLVIAGLVYLLQRKLQYFPDPASVPLPQVRNIAGSKPPTSPRLTVCASLAGIGREAFTTTLVIFHGNAGHRGHRLDWIEDLHSLGYGVFAPGLSRLRRK